MCLVVSKQSVTGLFIETELLYRLLGNEQVNC